MAISPDLPGVVVSVRVHNRRLPEYRDTDIQDPPRVISYTIEAIPDTVFTIDAYVRPEAKFIGSSFAVYFYVDGKYVDGALIDSPELRSGHGAAAWSQGRYVRDNMLRRYQFASKERQIELVETVSTSLSSRPRASKKSSMTPTPSYSGYESRNITPSTSSTPGFAVDERPASYDSPHITPAERYHSVSYAVHPTADTALPTRPVRGDSAFGLSNVDEDLAMTIDKRVPSLTPLDLDHHNSNTTKASPSQKYKYDSVDLPMRLANIAEEPFTSQPISSVPIRLHSSAATPSPFAKKDVESATAGSDFTAPEELGTIKIIVTHVNKKGPIAFGRNASTTAEIGRAAQEAAKEKSGGLLVRFTAPQEVEAVQTWDVGAVNEDDGEDTSVTYLYHYRTREMLEALEVVPMDVKEERIRPPGLGDRRWDKKTNRPEFCEEMLRPSKRKVGEMEEDPHLETPPELVMEDTMKEEGVKMEKINGEKGGVDDDWEMVDGDGP